MRRKKLSIETYTEIIVMMEIAVKDFKVAITRMPKNLKGNVNIMRREIFKRTKWNF